MVEAVVIQSKEQQTSSRYKGRNVANAPQIKASLLERSQQRQDSMEIQSWLCNHFFRYLVGNFQAGNDVLIAFDDLQTAQQLYGNQQQVPEWIVRKFSKEAENKNVVLWWIVPNSHPVLELEARLVEFLTSRNGTSLENKLERVNCFQALAMWTLEHIEFEKRRNKQAVCHQPDAVLNKLECKHGRFVEFDGQSHALRFEMAFESQSMGHCLGQFQTRNLQGGYGESYASQCEAGKLRLFSFRNINNQPHITISAKVLDNGQLELDQIKGKQNRYPVSKYREDVLSLLNLLPFNQHMSNDVLGMGIVRLPDNQLSPGSRAWRHASTLTEPNEQLWLLQVHASLLMLIPSPTPIVLWYAMGLQASAGSFLKKHANAMTDSMKETFKQAQSQNRFNI